MNYVKRTYPMGYRLGMIYYPAPAIENHTKKSKRKFSTSEEQRKRNVKYSFWKLQGLIMANFVPGQDLFVTLTCADKTKEEDAKKAISNTLRNLRNYCKRQGEKFEYIVIPEKQGNWHFHLITSNVPLSIIKKYWDKYGKKISISPLDSTNGYFDLVNYLLAEEKPSKDPNAAPDKKANAKRQPKKNEKKWYHSRGLAEPEDNIRILQQMPKKKPRPPKGYRVDESSIQIITDNWGTRMYCECVWIGRGIPAPYLKVQADARKRRKIQPEAKSPRKTKQKKE